MSNGVVSYAFTANTTGGSRTAHITLLGQQVSVIQLGLPIVTSSSANLAGNAATITITGSSFDPVAANNTVTFNNGAVGTVTAATLTTLTVTLTTAPTSLGTMTAVVTTDGVSSGSEVQVATTVASFVLGRPAFVEGPAAGADSVQLTVTPSAAWAATPVDAWLHLDVADSSGAGSATVVFTFDANAGATRTGTLTIAGQTLTVTQAGSTYVGANPVPLVASG